MPILNENVLPDDFSLTVPVVVVGNGPSGICLSYLLSGYTPYLASGATHPNPLLLGKLQERPELSFLDQDLEYLCEGLEGRSNNPVAVLFDSLILPDSDFGSDCTSPLQWHHKPEQAISHLVFGKGPPGGVWHAMEGSMLTLSLAKWMELPGLRLKDWVREKRRNLRNDRVTPGEIASYYKHYVSIMGLQDNFVRNTHILSVRRMTCDQETGEREDQTYCLPGHHKNCYAYSEHGVSKGLWEVRGVQKVNENLEVPFAVCAENVVLATGTQDKPAWLGVKGEDLPYVCHDFRQFEEAISRRMVDEISEPILIIGAGLTAADAVLAAHHLNIPVYHAFRRYVSDPALIFNQLPKVLYPEYHKVHQMMQLQVQGNSDATSYPGYTSYPKHQVVAFTKDKKCILEGDRSRQVLRISMAVVLIGANPNLSFLPDDGQYLAVNSQQPISCRHNPVDIDPITYESTQEPSLFAMGPLVGDNFVRFLKGGAIAIASALQKRRCPLEVRTSNEASSESSLGI
ncbi:oxidative stress induced growth inhibitor 1 [Erpetoichthys calabaricus]|uniref:Oxidative stress-induced growth inhibitor 1 n=1 Tax=Erpetoichthys calabaricus TaxID=27687 RepID=A0A8C4SEQ3_ERPCA|nr:oxidative stress induced growth inhibitor 1 [Erpetoichthys calabaricus]XP_028667720.1 oxidative stress induced growth inhibitor 1 [Erpetoichthys calabaricus]